MRKESTFIRETIPQEREGPDRAVHNELIDRIKKLTREEAAQLIRLLALESS